MSYDLELKKSMVQFIVLYSLKVTNGPSKTMGLAEFFFKAKKVLKSDLFAWFCK